MPKSWGQTNPVRRGTLLPLGTAIGAGLNIGVDVDVEGYSRITVFFEIVSATPAELVAFANSYDGENALYGGPTTVPVTSSANTAAAGNIRHYRVYDVAGMKTFRPFLGNGGVAPTTGRMTYILT